MHICKSGNLSYGINKCSKVCERIYVLVVGSFVLMWQSRVQHFRFSSSSAACCVISTFCFVSLKPNRFLASVFPDPPENCGQCTANNREMFVRGCNLNPRVSVCSCVLQTFPLPSSPCTRRRGAYKQHLQSCLSPIVTVGLFPLISCCMHRKPLVRPVNTGPISWNE